MLDDRKIRIQEAQKHGSYRSGSATLVTPYIFFHFLRPERGKAGRGRLGTGSRQTGARQTARQQTTAEVHEQGSEPDGKWD